jgi:lipid-A-disaccharide synthase
MATDVFLIAGEPSGDALGASLLKGLRAKSEAPLVCEGIGGPLMQEQGLTSLLPMEELCVMGLWEVVGHLPRLLKLIQAITEEIEERQPKVVVTIDLPDFNFQVAKRLKKNGIFKGRIVHYVAPSVWAWRPKRAKKIAAFLDGVMCLFPFEPPYFKKEGLRAAFVGHPLIEVDKAAIDPMAFRRVRNIPEDALCVGVFFGSRAGELKTLSPIFVETIKALAEQYPDIKIIVPTLPHLEIDIINIVKGLNIEIFIDPQVGRKWETFSACNIGLAVSGTVGLELAYLGVPHIIGYKAHPLTAFLVKRMAKVKHVHLANILLEREVIPEYLQGRCNAFDLTKGVMRLIRYEEERNKQKSALAEIEAKLRPEKAATPSDAAAAFVLKFLKVA